VRSEAFESALARLQADRDLDAEATCAVLDEAARAGDAEATLLAAYAAGVGYGRPIDYRAAVDGVTRAAELGEPRAQTQLTLLGGDTGDWAVRAAHIDLDGWNSAPWGKEINREPRIDQVEGFLKPQLCAWLIERARSMLEPSFVYDPKTGRPIRDDVRTNTSATFKLIDLDLPLILLRRRIASRVDVPVEHLERSAVFRYEPGQTFADHADYISTAFSAEIRERGQRPHTFIIYLNEGFNAGETHFLALQRKVRCREGGAIYWDNLDQEGRPDERTHHAGEPPTSGEKWLFSQFIRDKPQMPG
jgi:prolyl 4-hydroxylase